MPFLRWSFLRLAIGLPATSPRPARSATGARPPPPTTWWRNARRGDIDDVIATIDEFAYEKSFLINVGDEKGELLDAAVRRANPRLALELGTYCGYGSLRIARAAPSARVFSVEFAEANAELARRIWAHAGVDDRVTCVVGTIGDGGRTLDALAAEHGFAPGTLDFAVHRPRQERLPVRSAEHPRPRLAARGSIVVADNVLIPGAPKYRDFMTRAAGQGLWNTVEHKTHGEYQTLLPTWCWSRSS